MPWHVVYSPSLEVFRPRILRIDTSVGSAVRLTSLLILTLSVQQLTRVHTLAKVPCKRNGEPKLFIRVLFFKTLQFTSLFFQN